jgi:hypothetical protein
MACAMSDSAPLAIAGTEVLESIVRGGLAAPNDVCFNCCQANGSGFLCWLLLRQAQFQGCVKLHHEVERGPLYVTNISSRELILTPCRRCLTIERLSSILSKVPPIFYPMLTVRLSD